MGEDTPDDELDCISDDPDAVEMGNVLLLSTAHITKSLRDWLQHESELNLDDALGRTGAASTGTGYFMEMWSQDVDAFYDGVPEELKVLVQFGRECGARFLLLDRDVNPLDRLPTYDW